MKWMERYKRLIRYLLVGVCTTVLNVGVYYICTHRLRIDVVLSNLVAWVIAVTFAFFANRLFVFECGSWNLSEMLREAISFFMCRVLTGGLDMAIMFFGVSVLLLNDFYIKCLDNFIVILANYMVSKYLVFKNN